jgi:hypothetical protein
MKKSVLIIALFCLFLACDRNPDPSSEILKQYSFSFQTAQGKKLFAGEWVSDSVTFYAVNENNKFKDSVRVQFEVAKGGGLVTVGSGYTDKNGKIYTGWKLGSESFDQVLRANVYDLDGNFLTFTNLLAYGFRTGEWDGYSGSPEGSITGLVADTVNKFTLMVTNNNVYRQGSRYYIWNKVADPLLGSASTIDIDNNGVVYVSTWKGELIKSTDHGITWKECTKPYPDRQYSFYLYVGRDNYVWAFTNGQKLKYSNDGCITWKEVVNDYTGQSIGDIFRLKDGSLLAHGTGCCSLSRSFDEGVTWDRLLPPGKSNKFFVNEKDEIFLFTQINGMSLYKSSDYGATFDLLYNTQVSFVLTMHNAFNKWGSFYYVLVPGFGILKSNDLNSYNVFYTNSNLTNLFIDHNGVLIAKELSTNKAWYRKNN